MQKQIDDEVRSLFERVLTEVAKLAKFQKMTSGQPKTFFQTNNSDSRFQELGIIDTYSQASIFDQALVDLIGMSLDEVQRF